MVRMKKWFQVSTAFILAMSLVMVFSLSAEAAPVAESGALTSPPPIEFQTNSLNSSFQYLYDGSNSFTNLGNLQVKLTGTTYAYDVVDSIGVDITLQRWTGAQWVDVSTINKSGTNVATYSGEGTWSVTSGYYYRVKTFHWAKEGTVKESSALYSSSVLVTN
ncbi:hypothetical protein PASE110613_00250 [Paenibacillus sediminis]|uniref:Uncharacterized protein n=1 Tax=Paenibacillus sediminis TaxID=664909 RepID=A0ABS4H0F2_9BACL|nr:hypothetical protein [Paenibacillus sediminis]MBP1935990.1 hypothetical protein [Paenibacillus sediminis]